MPNRADSGLQTALDQRRQVLERVQVEMAARERMVAAEVERLEACQQRIAQIQEQVAEKQTPAEGTRLDVEALGELERVQMLYERLGAAQAAQVAQVRAYANQKRAELLHAHQGVRALEVVLERRAAVRKEHRHRADLRDADELAARTYASDFSGRRR